MLDVGSAASLLRCRWRKMMCPVQASKHSGPIFWVWCCREERRLFLVRLMDVISG